MAQKEIKNTTFASNIVKNVKFWGAVGDGITDDTAAIQSAIDSFGEYISPFHGGGISLFFPPGRYLISETLRIENNCQIIGSGSDGGTVIALDGDSNCDMMIVGFEDSSDPITLHFEGFRMVMDTAAQTIGWANIRCYNYIRHSHFNDLFLYGSTDYNLVMEQKNAHSVGRNNYFYGCAFEKGYNGGAYIVHDYNLNINSCYFGFVNTPTKSFVGLKIEMTAQNLKITNCWWLGENTYGNLTITGACSRINISHNSFIGEDIGLSGSCHVNIGSNVYNCIIDGNTFSGSDNPYDYCIRLGSAQEVSVVNNQFNGYSTSATLSSDESTQCIYSNYDIATDEKPYDKVHVGDVAYWTSDDSEGSISLIFK